MISQVIKILKSNDFYNESEAIEIAKGKYELARTWKQGYKKLKRELKFKK